MSQTAVSTHSHHSSEPPPYDPTQPDSSAPAPYHGPQMVAVGPGPAPYYGRRPPCPQFPCCGCGLTNKQGTVLTGILLVVTAAIRVLVICLIYFAPADSINAAAADPRIKEALDTFRLQLGFQITVILTVLILDFLMNLQLAAGVHYYENKVVCIIWIVWRAIYVVYLVYDSVSVSVGEGTWLLPIVSIFALNFYPLWVVIAFVMEPKNQQIQPEGNHV